MADPVKLPRRSRGPKPQFFSDPAIDHLMAMIIALTGELSVAIERHDTLERLLDEAGLVARKKVEAYRASDEVAAERVARRDDLIARVFQILEEQAQLAETMGKSTRADSVSYVADDRGAILGATDDPAMRKYIRGPAKKATKKAAKAKRTPAKKPVSTTAAKKAQPKRAAKKKPAAKSRARTKARR